MLAVVVVVKVCAPRVGCQWYLTQQQKHKCSCYLDFHPAISKPFLTRGGHCNKFACGWGWGQSLGDLMLPTENEASGYSFAVVAWMLSERAFPVRSHISLKELRKVRGRGGGGMCLPINLALLKISFPCFILQANILFPVIHKVDEPGLVSSPL